MKLSSSSSKSASLSSSNSKSKKNAKDREKRKSATCAEKNDQHTNDKGSPSKDGNMRKYAGIGPDSILVYSEQSTFEHLSEDVCHGFAEDLSYKLRYVIHDALIKARLSGRNHILSSDLDATFEDLNIDKVYGATSKPNWIALGDQNLYYLDDPVVNLVEVAEEECSYSQPADIIMVKKWVPDMKEVTGTLKTYYETMCLAVVSNDATVRQFALKDISENNLIGHVVEWFYRFGYFLLSKDITYDCLTLRALGLIKALEKSNIAPMIVSEKQLKLLVRLILQRLLRSFTTTEVLKPMCSVIAMLCERIPVQELVKAKLYQKIPEVKDNFALPIIAIINALGVSAIKELFIPNMKYFLLRIEEQRDADLISAVLQTYFILCRGYENTREVDENFYLIFGDSISSIWRQHKFSVDEFKKPEFNWLNTKLKLFRTRRNILYNHTPRKKYTINDVFPEYDTEYEKFNESSNRTDCVRVTFKQGNKSKWINTAPSSSLLKSELEIYTPDECQSSNDFIMQSNDIKPKTVLVGKRTLLITVLKSTNSKNNQYSKCFNHSLMYYNL